jgi:hypothetical protein
LRSLSQTPTYGQEDNVERRQLQIFALGVWFWEKKRVDFSLDGTAWLPDAASREKRRLLLDPRASKVDLHGDVEKASTKGEYSLKNSVD